MTIAPSEELVMKLRKIAGLETKPFEIVQQETRFFTVSIHYRTEQTGGAWRYANLAKTSLNALEKLIVTYLLEKA